jgi:preprotein translocase SecE subunit
MAWLMGQWGVADATYLGLAELSTSKLAGFALALAFAFAMHRITASRVWLTEVVDELTHVNWPSREETGHATVVVVVCVVVSALFLGLFDAAWLWLSSTVMGITGT